MQAARTGGFTCNYSMIIQCPLSVDVLGVFFLQFVMLPGFTINIIYVGMGVKVIWLTAFFYYVSLICHNQPLFQQSYSADVSFTQYVLMEFFSFSQCTVSKTETVTIQRATIGVSCTSQTNWIQLTTSLLTWGKLLTSQGSRGQRDSWKTRTWWKSISFIQHPMQYVSWYIRHAETSIP